MEFETCRNACYYDLIEIPHGHIPAPMVRFWDWLPIPVGDNRNYHTYYCPRCGEPSFFKQDFACQRCDLKMDWSDFNNIRRWDEYQDREKWRNRWKQLEYIFLPILVLLGKAKYMKSVRIHYTDSLEQYKKRKEIFGDYIREEEGVM